MSTLTMGPIVAEIMDAMGRPDAAETLRWSERPEAFEDVAYALEKAEEEVGRLTEEVGELKSDREDVHLYVKALKKALDELPKLVEAVSAETPHEDCGECAVTRLVVAVDEARKAAKDALKAVTP